MSTRTKIQATLKDLYNVPDDRKAEIIDGELVLISHTQRGPNRVAVKICSSLEAYEEATQNGYTFMDNMAFVVGPDNPRTFSPDVAYYLGEPEGDLDEYIYAAPTFAAEVRSKGDYGVAAERKMAEKRAAYFSAGTLVVWDVDVIGDMVVRVYRSTDPENPTIYRSGDMAEAEPAVPGWTMPVDRLLLKLRKK